MTAAQVLAHCSVSMQWAVGEVVPEKGAAAGTFDRAAGEADGVSQRRPATEEFADGRERDQLSGRIDRFAAGGAAGCTRNPHSFFGRIAPEEWAILMYKHLDHHLRQFGV
ncbi:MAG: DUF1569 domain-containing protein [Acidobacteriota bacterium]|nr:DUF1569 domain-containing protein [Acidobacteriota bacterium]